MTTLDLLGLGVILANVGLPLLWLTARAEDTEPASRHHRLVLVLGCANALLVAPLAWSKVPGVGGAPSERLQALATGGGPGSPVESAGPGPFALLALGWLGVVALGALVVLRDGWRLRRALEGAALAPESDSIRALQLARSLGVATPRLLVSPLVSVPCAASSWRPAIVLPVGLRERLTDAAFDCVLSHELAHLGRADQAWALAVALLRIPFALHPVTRLLTAGISLAREEAVDALVARTDAHTYATALVEVAAGARTGPGFPEAVFMGAHALSRRVHMLTTPRLLRRASLVPVVVLTLALGGLAATAAPSEAADSGEGRTLSMTVGSQKVITVPDLKRIAIGDVAVADVRTLGNSQILIKALSPGQTTMLVWTQDDTTTKFQVVVK